jgi:hypothetical protein
VRFGDFFMVVLCVDSKANFDGMATVSKFRAEFSDSIREGHDFHGCGKSPLGVQMALKGRGFQPRRCSDQRIYGAPEGAPLQSLPSLSALKNKSVSFVTASNPRRVGQPVGCEVEEIKISAKVGQPAASVLWTLTWAEEQSVR